MSGRDGEATCRVQAWKQKKAWELSLGAESMRPCSILGIHHVFDLFSAIEGLIFRIRLYNLRATHNTISNLRRNIYVEPIMVPCSICFTFDFAFRNNSRSTCFPFRRAAAALFGQNWLELRQRQVISQFIRRMIHFPQFVPSPASEWKTWAELYGIPVPRRCLRLPSFNINEQ